MRINPEDHLQKADEPFAAWMEETVAPGPTKTLRQHMEHEQIEKIFPGDGPDPVFSGFGMKIPERDHTVFAVQDILFADDAAIEISAKINECVIAVADVFAVNDPLFRAIIGHAQAVINNGLQNFCPEDSCQCLLAEEKPGRFGSP